MRVEIESNPLLRAGSEVGSLDVSPDGGMLALGARRAGGGLSLYTLPGFEAVGEIDPGVPFVVAARFAAGGRRLAFLGSTLEFGVCDPDRPELVEPPPAPPHVRWISAAAHAERVLLAGSITEVRDLGAGAEPVWTLPGRDSPGDPEEPPAAGALAAEGMRAAVVWDGSVTVYSFDSDDARVIATEAPAAARSVAWDPRAGYVAAIGWDDARALVWRTDGTADALDLGGSAENGYTCLRCHPDGRFLALGKRAGRVEIVDTETGDRVFSEPVHEREVTDIAFAPDGSRLFSCSLDRTVRELSLR